MHPARVSGGLILTIDIGTSSVRTLVYDETPSALSAYTARRSVDVQVDSTGRAELDARALCAAVSACIDETLGLLGSRAAQIIAVAAATMATTMVAVDAQGRPVGPLRTYADTRSDAAAQQLRSRHDERIVHARTGCMLRPNYWPARIAWLAQAHPIEWAQTRALWTLGAYLAAEYTGTACVTHSEAAWTGLLDRVALTWDRVWLADLGWNDAALPALHDVETALPPLVAAYAARWPVLAQVPWYGAIGDGAAANLGSGCVGADVMALTVGTTGALRIAVPGTPLPPTGLWSYRVDRQLALVGGATSEGGNVYQWLRDTLRFDGDDAALAAAVAALAPDAHGLTMLPLFAGERSPGWAGDARATIHGLHLGTTAVDLVRAGYEAIALRFGQIAASLPATARVVASGGALEHAAVWLQICADVLGRPVETTAVSEATSRGVAMLALQSLGVRRLADTPAPPTVQTYHPDAAAHRVYQAAAQRQQRLYRAVVTLD